MKKINIDNLLFRCHNIVDLLGVKGLGEIGKKTAIKTYIQAASNRTQPEKKFDKVNKGILLEDTSIQILNDFTGNDYKKNESRKKNQYFDGACDILASDQDTVIDIKNSWDVFTYEEMKISEKDNKTYEAQGRGYMDLYEVSNFTLVYTLLSSPIIEVNKAIEKEKYYNGGVLEDYKILKIANNMIFEGELFEEWLEQANFGLNISEVKSDSRCKAIIENFVHIPLEYRIHIKSYKRDEKQEGFIKERVIDARDFLKTIYK
jgi:hypothetical protein